MVPQYTGSFKAKSILYADAVIPLLDMHSEETIAAHERLHTRVYCCTTPNT